MREGADQAALGGERPGSHSRRTDLTHSLHSLAFFMFTVVKRVSNISIFDALDQHSPQEQGPVFSLGS